MCGIIGFAGDEHQPYPSTVHYDVVICGGGLAGQCVARQLRREVPEATVAVVERVPRPLPEATHKVGESHVELSSHYLATVLGLEEHLESEHLKKNGLRFLCGDSSGPIAARPEIGPAEFPLVPSYQIDRGRLENHLRRENEAAGVTLYEGESVRSIELGEPHQIQLRDTTLTAKWVLDATGRRRIIQKQLGLRRPSPVQASAAWFRIEDRVLIKELVPEDQREWHARDIEDTRWLSTVHMMGRGYWVWIIPLASGFTSIGVVANQDTHEFPSFNTPERFRTWLETHEPELAKRVADVEFADFGVKHNYSYLSERVMSADRWACLGEAGFFLDPLYSLGNDFLSMANCFAVRAIADDMRGEFNDEIIEELHSILMLLATDSSRTLSGNSDIFADVNVLGTKVWWDFFNYWGFSCAFFFSEIWRQDLDTLRTFRAMGQRWYDLNTHAQKVVEAWASLKQSSAPRKPFVAMPAPRTVLADQHGSLLETRDPMETLQKMESDWQVGADLVAELLAHALRDVGPDHVEALGAALDLQSWWKLPLRDERIAAEELPRRKRLAKLPTVARDLERAVGRPQSQTPLKRLFELAGRPATGSLPEPVQGAI